MATRSVKSEPIMNHRVEMGKGTISQNWPDSSRENLLGVMEQANHIASMTSLEDLLDRMLELMIDVSHAEAGTLYLLDREAGELVFKAIKGEKGAPDLVGMRIKQNQGIVGAAVQQGSPIVIDELSRDPRWYRDISPEESAHFHNAITLPLLLQGTPIGAVQIFNFKTAELELLQLLGNRMASEVDKVLLLEKAKRSNLRLKSLVGLLGQLGAMLDRDRLLDMITESSSSLLEAEQSTIMLIKDDRDGILVVSGNQSSDADLDTPAQTFTASDMQTQTLLAHSMVAVPLRAQAISVGKARRTLDERLIGNLMVLNKSHGSFDLEDTQLLEILASQASTVLQIATLYNDANQLFLDFIKTLAETIDAKDPYTRGHSQRVSDYSVQIAEDLGLSDEELMEVRIGSLLHDIGKIGVPDTIITKPDRLTPEEFEQMKKHPAIGYRILIGVEALHNMLPAVAEHHERMDGSGYPFGLRGEQISRIGKVVAVADVFDAMTTDRPYRKAMDVEVVFDHLQDNIGTHFDGDCVRSLINTELQRPRLR
jgi:HD-GYP domain-containing protein (c-di-GMP phosphodiesterase class II)/putative methionine-R-sulfoxide reductase with GAF domain